MRVVVIAVLKLKLILPFRFWLLKLILYCLKLKLKIRIYCFICWFYIDWVVICFLFVVQLNQDEEFLSGYPYKQSW